MEETIKATIIKPNQAIKLRARKETKVRQFSSVQPTTEDSLSSDNSSTEQSGLHSIEGGSRGNAPPPP